MTDDRAEEKRIWRMVRDRGFALDKVRQLYFGASPVPFGTVKQLHNREARQPPFHANCGEGLGDSGLRLSGGPRRTF